MQRCILSGRRRVQHRKRSPGSATENQDHGVLRTQTEAGRSTEEDVSQFNS